MALLDSAGIQLFFLGSGDGFGSGGRLQTCLYVQGLDYGFLIDCEASSLIAMKRNSVYPSNIGWILLTHLPGDHFGGLPFLVLDGQFSRRTLPLIIAGPQALPVEWKLPWKFSFLVLLKLHGSFPSDLLN